MNEQTEELRKASKAIYVACHEDVAKDVSRILSGAADEIDRLRATLKWVAEQQWNENADLDDICVRATAALSTAECGK